MVQNLQCPLRESVKKKQDLDFPISHKGIAEDEEKERELLRRRTEGNVPQAPVTADQVRKIIKEEQKDTSSPKSKSK